MCTARGITNDVSVLSRDKACVNSVCQNKNVVRITW